LGKQDDVPGIVVEHQTPQAKAICDSSCERHCSDGAEAVGPSISEVVWDEQG
jgi:hypothetical protein